MCSSVCNSLEIKKYLFVFGRNLPQAPIDMFEFVFDALKLEVACALYDHKRKDEKTDRADAPGHREQPAESTLTSSSRKSDCRLPGSAASA
jgi:hypothetical protein